MNKNLSEIRKKIDDINIKIKLLLSHYLDDRGVLSVSDRFEADELTYNFLKTSKVKKLIVKRNNISIEISNTKLSQGMEVIDLNREEQVIESFCTGVDDKLIPVYETVIKAIMDISKLVQHSVTKNKLPMKGSIELNSDKSLAHRLLIFSSLAEGKTVLKGKFSGLDIYSTVKCLRQLGVDIEIGDDTLTVHNPNAPFFIKPVKPLDAANSGTTMRMLAGILAGQDFDCQIIGDRSLSKRPMDRLREPLKLMGADIECREEKYSPIYINSNRMSSNHSKPQLRQLTPIDYDMPVASAQIKTAISLADLYTVGTSVVDGAGNARDHTEILLSRMGNKLPLKSLNEVFVPGDISNAAFYIVAALLIPGSEIIIKNILLNKTRTKYIEILRRMGADITIDEKDSDIEQYGDISVKSSKLSGTVIREEEIPSVIDEVPILAVAAAFSEGETVFEHPKELKHKESDRLSGLQHNLSNADVDISYHNANLKISKSKKEPTGKNIVIFDSFDDHRMAMTYTVFALTSKIPCIVKEPESVFISNPDFYTLLQQENHKNNKG